MIVTFFTTITDEEEMKEIYHLLPGTSLMKEDNEDYMYDPYFTRKVPQTSQSKLHEMQYGARVASIRTEPLGSEFITLETVLCDLENLMTPARTYLIKIIQIHMQWQQALEEPSFEGFAGDL